MLDGKLRRAKPPSAMLASSMGSEGEGSAVHEPLQFTRGDLSYPAGFWPMIDRDVLAGARDDTRTVYVCDGSAGPAIESPHTAFVLCAGFRMPA